MHPPAFLSGANVKAPTLDRQSSSPVRVNFRRSAIRGTVVTGAGAVIKALLQVLAIVTLARLLTPEDFGIMAMVFPIIALATIFQQAGLGLAALQRETISDEEQSTVFWLNLLVGTITGAIVVAISPFIADFYAEPRVQMLTAAAGALMVLGALSSQHLINLNRTLAFSRLALIDIVSLSVGTFLSIAVAYLTGSYWAVFLLSFGTAASSCLMAWLLNDWRPGRRAPISQVRDLLVFGANVTASNLAAYFGQNVDKILIGRELGAVPLGLYERAYKIVLLPILFVHNPMFRVLVPMLSQSRDNPERYRRLFILGFQLSLILTWPGTLLLIFATSEIVMIVMGEQWLGAAPIFFWLAIATLGQLATGPLSIIFVSHNRSREALISSVASSLFLSLAFIVGLRWGLVGVAASFAIAEMVRTPVMLWYATRIGPTSLRDIAQALAPFLLLTVLGASAVYQWGQALQSIGNPWLVVAVGGAITYGLAVLCMLLNRTSRTFLAEGWTAVRSVVRSKVGKKNSNSAG